MYRRIAPNETTAPASPPAAGLSKFALLAEWGVRLPLVDALDDAPSRMSASSIRRKSGASPRICSVLTESEKRRVRMSWQ